MRSNKQKGPLYLGIFAADPKDSHKRIRGFGKEALLEVLKHERPEQYNAEGEEPINSGKHFGNERNGSEEEVKLVERDFMNFDENEKFNSPPDNYHCTCLFMGGPIDGRGKQIQKNWKDGQKTVLCIEFIVYVPGYLMAGYSKP